jgi:hypothetical protein
MHQDDEIKNVNKRKVKKKKEQKRDVHYCVWILTLKYTNNVHETEREYISYTYNYSCRIKICQCNLKKKSL